MGADGHLPNVEIVREVMELASRDGEPAPRLGELLAADLQIDMSRRILNPAIYEGPDALARLRREREEVWEGFSVSPERMIEVGERVVAIITLRGRGRGSGVETESRGAMVWTVRDQRVVRVVVYPDAEEALESVGLAGRSA